MSKQRKIENLQKKLLKQKYNAGNYPQLKQFERENIAKSEAIGIIEKRIDNDLEWLSEIQGRG